MVTYRVRNPGFHAYTDRHGRRRCYHRKSRTPVDLKRFPEGSPEFLAECGRILQQYAVEEARPGTLGQLIGLFKASDDYRRLGVRTRKDYDRCLDYLAGNAHRALTRFPRPYVVKLRDQAVKDLGWRWGEYVRTVLSAMFTWGYDRGYVTENSAIKLKKQPRPKHLVEPNRPWEDAEIDVILAPGRPAVDAAAHPFLRAALACAAMAAFREGDVVAMPKTALVDGWITIRARKNGRLLDIPVHTELQAILDDMPRHLGAAAAERYAASTTLLCGTYGKPWTESGLRASWAQLKRKLEAEGRVDPGLTIHGLRHTVAGILDELEVDRGIIGDLIGDTLPMVGHYTRRSNKRAKLQNVVRLMEARRQRRGSGEEG